MQPPADLHDQIVAFDIDPRVTCQLTIIYHRALAQRLAGRGGRNGSARAVPKHVDDVMWLHPRAVWSARIPDAPTRAGDGVPSQPAAHTSWAPPPTLEHVTTDNEERWSRWGVDNLADYATRIDAEHRLTLAPAPLGERRSNVDEALEVLRRVWPAAAMEFHFMVRALVHVCGAGFRSATFDEVFGAVFVGESYLGSVPAAFEMVLHEGGHHALFLRNRFEAFVTNGSDMARHPLRNDPRPIAGTVHAAHVLARMATGLARWHDEPDAPLEVEQRGEQALKDLTATLAVLREKAAWTDAGRTYFAELERCASMLSCGVSP